MDKYNNVEYMRVYSGAVKGAAPVITWTGAEVNGLTRNQLAQKIAELLGREGETSISYKLTTGARWIVSRIVAFREPTNNTKQQKLGGMNSDELKRQYEELYQMKAGLLNEEISYLKSKISLLQSENSDLKKQLEDEGGDPGGLVTLFTQLSSMTLKNNTLKADQRQEQGEIPNEIQAVLSRIDYKQLTPDKVRELAQKLRQAISFFNLPLKQD